MMILYGIVFLLTAMFVYLVFQTLTGSTREATNYPIEEEEHHLFAERPHHTETKEQPQKFDQKNIVITELMINGTIDFARAKELGIKRLAGVIFRLRKHYKIDNVIVNGKFSHYKLIKYKGN